MTSSFTKVYLLMEDPMCCRICLEEGKREEFIAPCSCKGSAKWVHRACLDRWRTTREDKAFSKCTECLAPYKLLSKCQDSSGSEVTMRRMRYSCYVFRDLLLVFLLSQFIVLGTAYFVFSVDGKHSLAALVHLENHKHLCYYLFGWIFSLSFMGLAYSCSLIEDGPCSNCNNRNSCNSCNGMYCDYSPCYFPGNKALWS